MNEKYPSRLLEDAVEALGSLPGVGQRSALRLALHLLKQPRENVHHFTQAIDRLADEVKYCRECMMLSDEEVCSICSDTRRDHRLICVVESVRDVMSIEATGQYNGVYHVLGGIISPIGGVGPSDLTIRQLVERLGKLAAVSELDSARHGMDGPRVPAEPQVEVILALSGDVEGETTSFYIYRQIAPLGVKVSTLARGLGFGDDLEYADALTLGRSIVNRQLFKP
jgi:recombination protein RecR